jgi:hypothetical protein
VESVACSTRERAQVLELAGLNRSPRLDFDPDESAARAFQYDVDLVAR